MQREFANFSPSTNLFQYDINISVIFPITMKENSHDHLQKMRHSCAHLFAYAVRELYPDVQLTIGPAIDNGFYYDIDIAQPLTPLDLQKIQKKMKDLKKQHLEFKYYDMPVDEAIQHMKKQGWSYKVEMAEDLKKTGTTTISFYQNLDKEGKMKFEDMCEGPHLNNMNEIAAFELVKLAGAYWRGDEKNKMLQRVYGYCFETEEELEAYKNMMIEAEKRDHRKLGKELQLFAFDEDIGAGLPIWLPRGNIIKEQIEKWAKETEEEHGYQRVTTPLITKENLFYTSGHLPLYKESMYAPIEIEGENYYIKPMNCPFHHKIFSTRTRSYRELPLRLAEYGYCHRYEDSGSLFGMMRVRGMCMNDAHIYCSENQAVEEFLKVIRLHEYYYKMLGIKDYKMELALRDPKKMDKYHGDEKDWKLAEKMTTEAMEASGVPYDIIHEGAAFYGPKMDFQITSSIGRTFTASTNQLDLYMGKQFNLQFTNEKGELETPAIIHRAPLGTHERFIGFLIEHFAGAFPLWLAPEQVRIIPVSEKFNEYAQNLEKTLQKEHIRVSLDDSNESLGKRIRNAELFKIPRIVVVGEQEVTDNTVAVRNYFTKAQDTISVETFVGTLHDYIDQKTIESNK